MLKIFNILIREKDNELQLIKFKLGIHLNKWRAQTRKNQLDYKVSLNDHEKWR